MKGRTRAQSGFTLPELLVAGGILLVFVIAGAILISPKDKSADMRNAERRVDVAELVQAFNRHKAGSGELLPGISSEEKFIGSGEGEVDLCAALVPEYADDLPFDPLSEALTEATSCPAQNGDYITAYAIKKSGQTVTITAPLTEAAKQVEASFSY